MNFFKKVNLGKGLKWFAMFFFVIGMLATVAFDVLLILNGIKTNTLVISIILSAIILIVALITLLFLGYVIAGFGAIVLYNDLATDRDFPEAKIDKKYYYLCNKHMADPTLYKYCRSCGTKTNPQLSVKTQAQLDAINNTEE